MWTSEINSTDASLACTKVAIAGLSSEVGKTTLMCSLLEQFPGWEAIKMTRGHYRSCGKDPHACCVSYLLGDQPLIRSGFRETYATGKDTGRYWDAGAANVHWVVVTDDQVERGLRLALERIKSPGVLIEGNSFLQFTDVDLAVLVARSDPANTKTKIKASTRWAIQKDPVLYVVDHNGWTGQSDEIVAQLKTRFAQLDVPNHVAGDLSTLVTRINRIHSARTRDGKTNQGGPK